MSLVHRLTPMTTVTSGQHMALPQQNVTLVKPCLTGGLKFTRSFVFVTAVVSQGSERAGLRNGHSHAFVFSVEETESLRGRQLSKVVG